MITPELITNLATLSQLDISEKNTIAEAQQALQNIFTLIDAMNDVNVDDIDQLIFPLDILNNHYQPLRKDLDKENNAQLHMASNAPAHEDGFYLVPKVIE